MKSKFFLILCIVLSSTINLHSQAVLQYLGTPIPAVESNGSAVYGNYLYRITALNIDIYKIETPESPVFVKTLPSLTSVEKIWAGEGLLFIAADSKLKIFDLADPENPLLKSEYPISIDLHTVAQKENMLFVFYMSDYITFKWGSLEFVDITNPSNPVLKGTYKPGNLEGRSFCFSDLVNRMFVAHYSYGNGQAVIREIDYSDPANPSQLREISISGAPLEMAFIKSVLIVFKDGAWIGPSYLEAYNVAAGEQISLITSLQVSNSRGWNMHVLDKSISISLQDAIGFKDYTWEPTSGTFIAGPTLSQANCSQMSWLVKTVHGLAKSTPDKTLNDYYEIYYYVLEQEAYSTDSEYFGYKTKIFRKTISKPDLVDLYMAIYPIKALQDGCRTDPAVGGPYEYPKNSSASIAAITAADKGWNFKEWTGDASGTNPSQVIYMNFTKVANANFVQPILTLGGGGAERQTCPFYQSLADTTPRPVIDTIFNFSLSANEVDDWLVGGINFSASGTGLDDIHIKQVRLYMKPNELLSTGVYTQDNGNISLSINKVIPKGQTRNFYVEYEFLTSIFLSENVYTFGISTKMQWVTAAPLIYPNYIKLPTSSEFSGGPLIMALVFNKRTNTGFAKIQTGIDDASTKDGDSLLVCPCDLKEDVNVTKELAIKSIAGKNFTSVQGNNTAFTLNKNNTIIDGFTIFTSHAENKIGVKIENNPVENCVIKNNDIRYNNNGIVFDGPGVMKNYILNNYIYSNLSAGILFRNEAQRNTIGDRNVNQNHNNYIYANGGPGILFTDCDSNKIYGNEIGPLSSGSPKNKVGIELQRSHLTDIISNHVFENLGSGIYINNSDYNFLWLNSIEKNSNYGILLNSENDSSAANKISRNTITQNETGIGLNGAMTMSNIVSSNVISKSTNEGVYLSGNCTLNKIGYTMEPVPGDSNTYLQFLGNDIFGSGTSGILIENADSNIIYNNIIGINPENDMPEANNTGISIINGMRNRLNNNTVSASIGNGIQINLGGYNYVSASHIGTDKKDAVAIPNGGHGIWINNSPGNVIGDTQLNENVICSNRLNGIYITGLSSSKNIICNNDIGLGYNSANYPKEKMGNQMNGICIEGAGETYIGGDTELSRNSICTNNENGIMLKNCSAKNIIKNNLIGATGNNERLPNGRDGIHIFNSKNPEILNNMISGNRDNGIYIDHQSSSVLISANMIGLDKNGINIIPNENAGVNVCGKNIDVNKNVISGNNVSGVFISNSARNTIINSNIIGLDKEGKVSKPNILYGIETNGRDDLISYNVISGNTKAGIYLSSTGTTVIGNLIGLEYWGTYEIPNHTGVLIEGGEKLVFGNPDPGKKNLISGNLDAGVRIKDGSSIDFINNCIGISANGNPLPNLGSGFYITGKTHSISISKKNMVMYNKKDGICFENCYPGETGINTIDNNIISSNLWNGVSFRNSSSGMIVKNTISNNLQAGVLLYKSARTSIFNNSIFKNASGIKMVDCPSGYLENTTANNNIDANTGATGIHLTNSYSVITGNQITNDKTDGIKCELGSTAKITNNNIFNNSGFGLVNSDPDATIDARGNWWGVPGGPTSGTCVQGNINSSAWLENEVSLVAAFSSDTTFTQLGSDDSVTVMFNNLKNCNDAINITLQDDKNWLKQPLSFTVNTSDSSGAKAVIKYNSGSRDTDRIVFNASSTNNPECQINDTIYICSYKPEIDRFVISPDSVCIKPGGAVTFKISASDQNAKTIAVNALWSSSLGSVTQEGLFTADSITGTCTITATDNESGKTAKAYAIIAEENPVLNSVVISPDTAVILTGEKHQFNAKGYNQFNYPYSFITLWQAQGGSIDDYGLYTAGDEPGEFVISATDTSGNVSDEALVIITTVSGIEEQVLPAAYSLSQNYPNPFNPATTIRYTVPAQLKTGYEKQVQVKLIVYDILGRVVEVLVNTEQKPGYYNVAFNASNYASGIYLYRLTAGKYSSVKKMILVK